MVASTPRLTVPDLVCTGVYSGHGRAGGGADCPGSGSLSLVTASRGNICSQQFHHDVWQYLMYLYTLQLWVGCTHFNLELSHNFKMSKQAASCWSWLQTLRQTTSQFAPEWLQAPVNPLEVSWPWLWEKQDINFWWAGCHNFDCLV